MDHGMHDDADAERLAEAIRIANIPVLIPVLVTLTGELRWLEPPYAPERNRGLDDNPTGGLPEPVQEEIRAAALDALRAWMAGRPPAIPEPSDELLVRMLGVTMGEEVPAEYGAMIAAELGLERATVEHPDYEVPDGFRALIVGAGLSGLAMALRLQEAGIPFEVVEKNDSVGGTWLENRYPGAGVDTPSGLYSFSFAPHDWARFFALRDELHGYLEDLSRRAGVRDRIEFRTEVLGAVWDADAQRWTVTTRDGDGDVRERQVNVVISAVGGLNRPKMPSIPGLDSFAGPCVHTARWPEDLDVTGKRVGVIGNGASAMQVVPAIAERVAHLTVFQRSPQWAAPFEQFQKEVPEPLRWLSAQVPLYRLWYRLRAGWTFNDRVHAALQKDPSWEHPERAVSRANDAHRRHFTRYIRSQLGDREDLIEKVTPDYPPFGKRILLDNGWYQTLLRDDVELVTEALAEVVPDGIVTRSGEHHRLDVLVCATGFDAARFLAPMDIRGRSGRSLRETWDDDDPRAYLGMTVPDFPNLFILYGPNTQAGHGGSLIGSAEVQVHYILDLIEQMLARDIGAVEPRREAYERHSALVDRLHERMIWTHPGMDTYYRNSRGRVVVSTPFRVVDYWHMARSADLDQYELEPAADAHAVAS
jgi:4-hydroxyacetophenone monooxygenase